MTLEEIIEAVDDGVKVYWKNNNYVVEKWADGYNIVCTHNRSAIGLTWMDDKTINGKEEDFYIGEK